MVQLETNKFLFIYLQLI